jgi:XapX domain-containing protein
MKSLLGLALAFAIGFACRAFDIPSPAPPVIVGALLVVAMTVGYLLVDRALTRPARHALDCGGPSGLPPSATTGSEATSTSLVWTTYADRFTEAIYPLAAAPAIRFIALLGLCAAYLQGGLTKLLDFGGAVAEAQHFGLPFAPIIAGATIATELAASALVLSGVYRWFGALWLAAFTLIATFVANRFWEIPLPDRFMAENGFFEHLGLVGGFLFVAWLDLREGYGPSVGGLDAHSEIHSRQPHDPA